MEPKQTICRLCLKICYYFKAIEGDIKDMLHTLVPKMDLAAIQEPVMCTNCANMLTKYFDFKAACFCTRNYIIPFVNTNNADKLDMMDVYRSGNENGTGLGKDQDICGFCVNPVEKSSALSFDIENGDVLRNMIKKCLPELDLSLIKNPVICPPCHESLENSFRLVTDSLIVEESIKEYRNTLNINSKDQIELSKLLQFTTRDVTTSEADANSVEIFKAEKQLYEERENAEKSEIDKGHNMFKLEKMFCDDNETSKDVIEYESESYMVNVEDLKFDNEEQFTPKDVSTYKEERNTNYVIKTEESCGEQPKEENLVEIEDQTFVFKKEIKIERDDSNFDKFVKDGIVLPQPEVTTGLFKIQECLMSNLKGDASKPRIEHTSTKEHVAMKIRMYQCHFCSFQTKRNDSLKIHLLKHKDPADITMYKCIFCSFETVQNSVLKKHLLVHTNPSEVTMYKCASCSFQTRHRSSLRKHFLVHKDPSEVTMYKCASCSFQTRKKSNLTTHLLVHKDPSEVIMFKCDSCTYETKNRTNLTKHVLVHKTSSEVPMYKCDSCSYQTKYKKGLKGHSLVHKDPSEVIIFKCDSCSFQTRYGSSIKKHLLVHKDNSEVTTYKCESCSYQTRKKGNLVTHLLLHTNPAEITMYQCDFCSYQTKYKKYLKVHCLKVHKRPSEETMYKCDFCSFQTRDKKGLRRHLLVQKHPSELRLYKCTSLINTR